MSDLHDLRTSLEGKWTGELNEAKLSLQKSIMDAQSLHGLAIPGLEGKINEFVKPYPNAYNSLVKFLKAGNPNFPLQKFDFGPLEPDNRHHNKRVWKDWHKVGDNWDIGEYDSNGLKDGRVASIDVTDGFFSVLQWKKGKWHGRGITFLTNG